MAKREPENPYMAPSLDTTNIYDNEGQSIFAETLEINEPVQTGSNPVQHPSYEHVIDLENAGYLSNAAQIGSRNERISNPKPKEISHVTLLDAYRRPGDLR